MPISVALVNDFEIVLQGLAAMLEPSSEIEVVELDFQRPPTGPVDVALIDSFGRGKDVIALAKSVISAKSAQRVAIFTWSWAPEFSASASAAGISACLSKSLSAEDLIDSIIRIHNGEMIDSAASDNSSVPSSGRWPGDEHGLTEREGEVLALIAAGYTNKEISESLFLSPNSIKTYIRRCYEKIGVSSRSKAILWAVDNGFVARKGTQGREPSKA